MPELVLVGQTKESVYQTLYQLIASHVKDDAADAFCERTLILKQWSYMGV